MLKVLRCAVQKSGRLAEESVRLLKDCGFDLETDRSSLKTSARNFPLQILFLRDDDIPTYIKDDAADIGIVGENILAERNLDLQVYEKLGFGRCRLSIAVPNPSNYKSVGDLEGVRIASSYPRILQRFLDQKRTTASIYELSGSVEIAPSIGLSEAICDLVSSGSTIASNGLRELEIIAHYEACLIGKPESDPELLELLAKLRLRVTAVRRGRCSRYIMLNAPNSAIPEISKLIPGEKSPSVLPLADTGWSSIHSVVNENDFWGVIEKLKNLGAEGILVLPIGKMVA